MKEALKLALEALEEYVNVVVSVNDPNEWTPKVADVGEPARKAITAIKEALAQPEQEPVGFVDSKLNPIQRSWVSLTDEDLKLLSAEWRIVYGAWMDDFARDIEAKLKEKNT